MKALQISAKEKRLKSRILESGEISKIVKECMSHYGKLLRREI